MTAEEKVARCAHADIHGSRCVLPDGHSACHVFDYPALAPTPSNKQVYEFDRYVRGQLKAEGIRISKARSLDQAMRMAAEMAYPHDVLVLRSATETSAVPCMFCSRPFRDHEPMILRGEEKFDARRGLVCPSENGT
jgi:hypothetical protein